MGKAVAERALEKGIRRCSFDRSGFQYHGRVQALADAAVKLAFSSKVEVSMAHIEKQAGELQGKLITVNRVSKTVKGGRLFFLHSSDCSW